MKLKPPRWNISPALIAPGARDLWKGVAFVAPLWDAAGGKGALLGPHGGPLAGSNLVAGSAAEKRGTPYGLGVGGTAASTHLLYQDNFAPITTSDGAGTGDFTLLILANPVAEATIREALSQTVGGSGPRVDILFNTAEDITASSGSLCIFTTATNAANRTSAAVAGPVDGNYHLFCARRSGSDLTLWVDGVLRATVTGTIRDVLGTGAGFAIGNRAESPSFPLNTDTNVVLSAGWNRALSDAEIRLLARDRFCMFRPEMEWRGVWTPISGGITGALSATEADDAVASAGTLPIAGAGAITEAGDTLSATATLAITGSLSATEADDTLAAAGAVALAGSASITDADDTAAATGALAIAGAIAVTEADDTLAATGTGTQVTTGVLNATEADDTLAAAGALAITGSAVITESGDTSAAAGALPIAGAAALAEDSDSIVSTGALAITGTANITESGDTLSTSTAAEVNAIVFRVSAEPFTFRVAAEPCTFRVAA